MANPESKRLLRDCDLVVLPYQDTLESASGAVRIALASGAPVAVSPLPIFEDTLPATSVLPGVDADSIAEGIDALLMDYKVRAELQAEAAKWASGYAWPKLSVRLAGMIRGLVATSLLPGGANRFPTFEVERESPQSRANESTAKRRAVAESDARRPGADRNAGANALDLP